MKRHILLYAFAIAFPIISKSQIVLNEIASKGTIADASGNNQDWIEIYNAGGSPVNLFNYGLSDDATNPLKWKLPDITLSAGGYLLVLANGNDLISNINHWESAVLNTDTWKYFIGTSEPPVNWKDPGFDDTGWSSGTGGIGFGDGDDGTVIPSTTSVYLRKSFFIGDTSVIETGKLHIDYDDAFVFYLNGFEIARSGNIIGTPPAHNTLATSDHEAGMYAGYPAELWDIPADVLNALLVEGDNYFCLQVNNASVASSDLSSNAWLSFGIKTADTYFSPVPFWFTAPYVFNQTNFSISNAGETIYLSDASGIILDSKFTGEIALGQSTARIPDAAAWCVTPNISPEISNNSAVCYAGYEPDPVFSINSGFYPVSQIISISSPSPTSIIHYTTDGSAVTEFSPIYSAPITVSTNTVISAKCFSSGTLLPGNMSKQTYFINEADYALPVLSITIDPSSLFDYDTGIYEFGCCYDPGYPYYGANFWQPWTRYGHIEYFDPEGNSKWSKDMGLEIHGGWSRAEAQRSFRIDFKNEYDGNLDYPLWREKPEIGPINNFNLRNGGQHVWTYKFQDAFLAEVMKETHIDYEAYEPCALFINGDYWGWYEIREKADEHYVESNYGIDNNQIDFLNSWTPLAGSDTGFVNWYNYTTTLVPNADAFYNMFQKYCDVENYVDYYIGEIYYQNVDFGGYYWGVNNTKCYRNQNGGKFRFIMYDMDGAMGYFGSVPADNYINLTRNPSYPNAYSIIFDNFLDNYDFRDYFVNRFADLLNTIYLQDNMESIMDAMKDSIDAEIIRQVSRWGGPTEPTVNYYMNTVLDYNETRHVTARNQINTSFGLDGQRTITLSVSPAGAGYIHLNTITPTDLPWDGVYYDGVPVTMTVIANPGYTFDHWDANDLIPAGSEDASITVNMSSSETFNAVFNGSPVVPEITITEINYNSNNDLDAGDWIEIHNNGATAIDISEWELQDANPVDKYKIPFGTILNGNSYLVIANDPSKFKLIYPSVLNVIGGFSFNFDNAGDEIKLTSLNNVEVFSMHYADSLPWPRGADGTGRTLELNTLTSDITIPTNWFDGCLLGSPGTYYTSCNDAIVFGEINYHSDAAMDAGDWIELWNITSDAIDISGWKFVDDKDTLLFQFADGTMLESNERFVVANDLTKFASRHAAITNYTGPFLFGLDGGGEELRLIDDKGALQFTMIYDDEAPWTTEPDGDGETLELLSATGKMNNAENWFAGCPEGSPTMVYDPACDENISVENINTLDFTIYPNPSSGSVFIQLNQNGKNISIQFSDNSGKILQQIENVTEPLIEIKRNQLASGIYWIKIISDDMVEMKQVVLL